MDVFAGKPFRIKLKQNGKARERWQVILYTKDNSTEKITPVSRKTFKTRTEASDKTPELIRDFEKTQGNVRVGKGMTFSDLVAIANRTFYAPAKIRNGKKSSGIKSVNAKRSQLKFLEAYFGHFKIGNIHRHNLEEYKERRFEEGSQRGKDAKGTPIKDATVNRELSTMRRLLNHALREGWIVKSPFEKAGQTKLIDPKAEEARVRILSKSEEELLLTLCEPGKRTVTYPRKRRGKEETVTATAYTGNKELKAAVLLAADSGLRRQEILRLEWGDCDLDEGVATIRAETTKTETGREVFLSDRVVSEMKKLPTYGKKGPIFTISDLKRSWETARSYAGVKDLRFHDLRATAATRMIESGTPLEIVAKILGDRNLVDVVYKHYVRVDRSMLQNVRERMNTFNSNPRADSDQLEREGSIQESQRVN